MHLINTEELDLRYMKKKKFMVTESIDGFWHYHISEESSPAKSLCGTHTMKTSLSMDNWGFVGHLAERYCKTCFNILEAVKSKEGE